MNEKILITGSTGNIGGQLVLEILSNYPRSQLKLLIRGAGEADCSERLETNLRHLDPDFDFTAVLGRIEIFRGDITRNDLGLQRLQYNSLMRSVTHVVHSAASTKFQLPLDQARFINCRGTENVLKFIRGASQGGRLVDFAYISTAYVCGEREGYIKDRFRPSVEAFSNPYEQSKHEAEVMVRSRLERLPYTIFRPSIVVGNSRTGRIASFNALYTPLKCIIRGILKTLPCDPDTPLDIVPLDFVGRAVAAIFLRTGGGRRGVYHITAGERSAPTVRQVVSGAIAQYIESAPDDQRPGVEYGTSRFQGPDARSPYGNSGRAAHILAAYAPYICRKRIFSSRKIDNALGRLRIRRPAFSQYFPVVIDHWLKSDTGLLGRQVA